MNDANGYERCAVCRRDLSASAAFCHFHSGVSSVALCSPACAEKNLRGAERCSAAPNGNLMAELVEEWSWTWGHSVGPGYTRATSDGEFANRSVRPRADVTALGLPPQVSDLGRAS